MQRLLAVLALLFVPTAVRADLTVIYAPASRPAPWVASTVCGPQAEPVSYSPRPEPAESSPTVVIPDSPRSAPASPSPSAPRPVRAGVVAPQVPPPASPQVPPPASPQVPPPASPQIPPPASPQVPPPASPQAPPPASPQAPPPACTARPPVLVVRSTEDTDERAWLVLTDCAGRPDADGVVALSILARPRTLATRPSARELSEHAADPTWVAAGIRRLHPGLLERLQVLADQFPGHALEIIAGGLPRLAGENRHAHGLALDLRVQGVSLGAAHAFARSFDRTGVGLYPALGFMHLDVRQHAVHWIEEDGGSEGPRLVRDDTRTRGGLVRSAALRTGAALPVVPLAAGPAPASGPGPTPAPSNLPASAAASPASPSPLVEQPVEENFDADDIADEVLRGLEGMSLEVPSS